MNSTPRPGRPIVVIGSSNTDMVLRLDKIPRPGETRIGGGFATASGGKGANQAVGAARAGGRVSLVACLGRDVFGEEALAGFIREGIDVTHVQRSPDHPSGVALIFVDASGENSIGVASGANLQLSPEAVRRASSAIRKAAVVVAQLEIPLPAVQAALEIASRERVTTVLNPAPARPLADRLLRMVSILTPNETEAEELTGIRVGDEPAARRAARALRDRGVPSVVLTLGSRGALVSSGAGEWLVPGFRVKTVDTTAAGDIFNGALAVALSEDRPLPEAVRFANAAAAISVTRAGAQPSAPARSEIDRLLLETPTSTPA
ncbi:MAG: ribokinase [Verrucomicrobiota bacterium]